MSDLPALSVSAGAGSVLLEWGWPEGATEAVLDVMSPDFNFFSHKRFTEGGPGSFLLTGPEAFEYIGFRIRYMDGTRQVGETGRAWNPYCRGGMDSIGLAACESWNGISIGFRSHVCYDRFRLYELQDGAYAMVAETEDFQVASRDFTPGNTYYVEGFLKDKATKELVLAGMSAPWQLELLGPKDGAPLVSIVVPCYNIQRLLPRTLDSFVMQSISGLEVIAIDDASTDRTPDILKWYSEKYPFIRVITHEVNQYVTTSRNEGIAAVSTDYVTLSDDDDMMHYDMCRMMYDSLQDTGADVALCRIVINNDFGDRRFMLDREGKAPVEVYTYEEVDMDRKAHGNLYFVPTWGRLYRKSIVDNLYFPDEAHGYHKRQSYEDVGYTAAMFTYADKIAMVYGTWYVWEKRQRQTIGSLSVIIDEHKDKTAPEVWDHYMVSLFLYPLRLARPGHDALMQYKQCQIVMEAYTTHHCADNKTETDKVIIRRFQEGIREFNLIQNPYVRKDPKMLATMLYVQRIKV